MGRGAVCGDDAWAGAGYLTRGGAAQEEDEDEDDDACLVEPEDKPPPVMRHQWMRGSIDDSQVHRSS